MAVTAIPETLSTPNLSSPSSSTTGKDKQSQPTSAISIRVEFSGGLELLFQNQRKHTIQLPVADSREPTIADLIEHLSNAFHSQLPKSRRDLFSLDPQTEQDMQEETHEEHKRKGKTVRPGILVLVNDADWELEEERETVLHRDDEVVFVSTLHGG